MSPVVALNHLSSFVLGSIFAVEKLFRWTPWTEMNFKIAPRDQTDAGPFPACAGGQSQGIGH